MQVYSFAGSQDFTVIVYNYYIRSSASLSGAWWLFRIKNQGKTVVVRTTKIYSGFSTNNRVGVSIRKKISKLQSLLEKLETIMALGGRVNIGIFAMAFIWSVFVFVLYLNDVSSCLKESNKLRMAVERKDRFVELLRDQNDNLKGKLLRLQETSRKEDRTRESRVYLVKELPLLSNATVWREAEKIERK